MGMPTFRVTEEKLREHFGKSFQSALNPILSSKWLSLNILVISVYAGFLALLVYSYFTLGPLAFILPMIALCVVMIIAAPIAFFFTTRSLYADICAPMMKDLVNDKELLWLNSQGIHDTVKKWSSTRDGGTNETSFKILSYLKKRGTAQGLHTTVKSLQDSGSANTQLKRMSGIRRDTKLPLGPLVENVGNDYHYLPWQFKIVDRNNKPVTTPEAAKMERLLIQCWESMIDGNL
jgi:hypothetical protein